MPGNASTFRLLRTDFTFRVALAFALSVVATSVLSAQTGPTTTTGDDRLQAEGGRAAPLARLVAGPFVITPQFRIGELAVDTNVFYLKTRKSDFLASGGPGLGISVAFADHWRVSVEGNGQYYYFLRNKELRRWGGDFDARIEWKTTGTRAGLVAGTTRNFQRLNFEIDRRVEQRTELIAGYFARDLGRFTVGFDTSARRYRLGNNQFERGADLVRALSRDEINFKLRASLRLTPITSLVTEAETSTNSLVNARVRDYERQRAGIGFASTGLFTGSAVGGFSRTSLKTGVKTVSAPYFRAFLTQQVAGRVQLREAVDVEQVVSAFAVDGDIPTIDRLHVSLGVGYTFLRRMSVNARGDLDKIKSLGKVRITLDDGKLGEGKRDDTAYTGDVDLGIQLGEARIAGFARYTTRASLFFTDLGINGLQLGARVTYAPKLSSGKDKP